MKKLIVTFLPLVCGTLLYGQSVVTGYVYNDANGNGQRDRREQGVAGVSVSNGTQVATSGQDGRYELPVGQDNIIFVIKPSGYVVPVDENNLPQFYYIHKPNGSPALKYGGVAATGALPKSVDFPLIQQEEPNDFTALIFGDPQPYTDEDMESFNRGVVAEVKAIQGVAFGLSLGDLVGDNLSMHNAYLRTVAQIGLPWYNLMGNHDMDYDATADSLADETFEASFGPANYAFNYGNAHFIVLDDILYPDPRDGSGYWGGFRKEQLDFVENDLKQVSKDKLIVLAFHIPLLHENEGSFRNADRQRLFDLLKDFPYTFSMSAHTHLQRQNFYGREAGWHQDKPHHEYNAGTTSGDWYSGELNEQGVPVSTMRDGTPKGYIFLHIRGNRYVIDYKVANAPKEFQIKLFHPKVVAQGRGTSSSIFANFFMGREGDKVEYRVDNDEWKPMNHIEEPDPDFVWSLYRWDITEELMPGRRPSNAVTSTHLWRANVPTNLPIGVHQIEVRATDMFGRTFTQQSTYRLAEPVTQ
ncbi:calcineurin-like phosphoesterase C-terminal domain-containing protein [Parapedobacter koreensis]|uniref:Calcineurin-like phosphoesterase n=1 Tax=Parapedobacter koreensis TaxID=332977 RepID=A0A1H7FJN4_9SPHI|nr:calcineurin-like phosphoesterase family protein [Parapedobacter koreensis]SEK26168.1 Calcineurin-like phosphoesterase [Parapedobacter koreensis]